MRTIIAGSRRCTDMKALELALAECGWVPTVILSGTARGADLLGEEWAKRNNVLIERFPANWEAFGKSAGFMRNYQMAENAEALVALWDGQSRGTASMISISRRLRLRLYIQPVSPG